MATRLKNPTAESLTTPTAGRAALKAFFRIADQWEVTNDEARVLLGGISRSTFFRYRALPEVSLNTDTLDRISYILGIYKSLHILFSEKKRADEWVKRPNAAAPFFERSALDFMLQGHLSNLAETRRYLDAWRG